MVRYRTSTDIDTARAVRVSSNHTLASFLERAGWTPRQLAKEINKLFGTGTVSETAPYYWRERGGVPHAPLPTLAAFTLGRHLGERIPVDILWEGKADETEGAVSAATGLDLPWDYAATLKVAEGWLMAGMLDRRVFMAVSGAALARAVVAYLSADGSDMHPAFGPSVVLDSPLVDQIEQSIPLLQRLDDAKGGAANLSYVGAQVRAVSLVLREDRHDSATTRRLLMALADLSQLAGWMAIDANRHGLAQRYLFTALRSAHAAGYNAMAGHILADLSGQATTLGNPKDAILLGEAAVRAARLAPPRVRASIYSRLAHAYAGAGDLSGFQEARVAAVDAISASCSSPEPDWMYYLTPNHLDCQAGYSLIMLGRIRHETRDGVADALLKEGQELLERGAYMRSTTEPSQRRALYEGAWLAVGHALRGQTAEACAVGRIAMARLDQVKSPRSVAILTDLGQKLAARNRNKDVREFLPDLRTAVAHAAG